VNWSSVELGTGGKGGNRKGRKHRGGVGGGGANWYEEGKKAISI